LVTPPLDGTILPGVTRDSVLTLTRSWNEFSVSERKITMHDLTKAIQSGRLKEMFGAGTAAIVSPIRSIHWRGQDYAVPLDPNDTSSQAGPLTRKLSTVIMDIQYGVKDFENWSEII
jgi:branched-chain amino acid aminotransferase